jgi:mono/diheme cytochrome c family protein
LLVAALAAGCSDDGDEGGGDGDGDGGEDAARIEAIAALVDDGSFEADGEAVYRTSCASCHGGQGQGAIGPQLAGVVADNLTVAEHVEVVFHGRGGTNMVAWKGQITDDEIAAVVAYERTELGG